MKDQLIVKGARQHNLKNIDISLPRDKFIVVNRLSHSIRFMQKANDGM